MRRCDDHLNLPWTPAPVWADTTAAGLIAILDDIERGTDKGERYSNAPATGAERQVWPVVQRQYPDKPEGQCRRIISAWLETGLLYPDDYKDPVQRRPRKGLFVDATKRPS
jgi:hypothetical protein